MFKYLKQIGRRVVGWFKGWTNRLLGRQSSTSKVTTLQSSVAMPFPLFEIPLPQSSDHLGGSYDAISAKTFMPSSYAPMKAAIPNLIPSPSTKVTVISQRVSVPLPTLTVSSVIREAVQPKCLPTSALSLDHEVQQSQALAIPVQPKAAAKQLDVNIDDLTIEQIVGNETLFEAYMARSAQESEEVAKIRKEAEEGIKVNAEIRRYCDEEIARSQRAQRHSDEAITKSQRNKRRLKFERNRDKIESFFEDRFFEQNMREARALNAGYARLNAQLENLLEQDNRVLFQLQKRHHLLHFFRAVSTLRPTISEETTAELLARCEGHSGYAPSA